MNRDGDKSVKSAPRCQKPPRTQQQQQQVSAQKKKTKDPPAKDARSCSSESEKEQKVTGSQGKRAGKVPSNGAAEYQRKLSDASNASEDLSKDSGCLSGKLSTSDSSSEISDCPSEGSNKRDSQSSEHDLSWIDGKAYVNPSKADGKPCAQPAAGGGGSLQAKPGVFDSPEAFMQLMMGETTEDLVREVDDLRSENEYLKVSLILILI